MRGDCFEGHVYSSYEKICNQIYLHPLIQIVSARGRARSFMEELNRFSYPSLPVTKRMVATFSDYRFFGRHKVRHECNYEFSRSKKQNALSVSALNYPQNVRLRMRRKPFSIIEVSLTITPTRLLCRLKQSEVGRSVSLGRDMD